MRTETRYVYRYSELGAEARAVALDEVRERQAEWIEPDELAEVMVEQIGFTLGQHQGGLGEPLRGIALAEWSIDRNGRDSLSIEGTLTRDNAPALPWPDDCGYARFGRTNTAWTGSERDLWLIDPETGDAPYPEWMADHDRDDVQAFFDAVDEVISKALTAGCQQYDYLTGEEHAEEWLDANDPEVFDPEGRWV